MYSGPADGLAAWLDGYASAGATDLVLRFAGDHERHLEAMAKVRASVPHKARTAPNDLSVLNLARHIGFRRVIRVD